MRVGAEKRSRKEQELLKGHEDPCLEWRGSGGERRDLELVKSSTLEREQRKGSVAVVDNRGEKKHEGAGRLFEDCLGEASASERASETILVR